MSVALTVVVRTGDQRSAATVLASLLDAVELMPDRSGGWHGLTVHGASRQRYPVKRSRGVPGRGAPGGAELSGAELRGLLPHLDGDDVRIAVSTSLVCWRFPGEAEPERLPMTLRVGARGAAFRGWGDERGEGVADLVLDPVWPFRTPGGTLAPRDAAQYNDNRDLLVRLIEAVVATSAPASVRVHTDVSSPLPFDAHLLYYRDPAAVLGDLRWIAELWERGEASRRIPPLRDVPEDQLWRELHEWRPRSTLAAVRAGLGRTVAVLDDVGPSQIEAVLVAGSCPVRRLGEGFLVFGGEAFVDGFVDPFFTELADVVGLSDPPDVPFPVPSPVLPWPDFDVRIFFAGLLASTSAEQRAQGLSEWAEYGGMVDDLVPLLDDGAPLVRERAGRSFVVEVRAPTLVTLQDRCRAQGTPWPFGPVRVRRAMPVEEAEAQAAALLADLAPQARADAEAAAERVLHESVNPRPEHSSACRAYIVLHNAGRITHELQDVAPGSLLTPLQQEVLDGQLRSPRPRPHVRFDDPTGRPVGHLYSALGRFVLDLDESGHAARVREHLATGVRHGMLPPWGAADLNVLGRLREVVAYVSGAFHAELVRTAAVTVRVESYRRDRADDECGELTFWLAGRRLVAETRLPEEAEGDALVPGRTVDVELWLSRWFDEYGPGLRADGPASDGADRLIAEDGVRHRIEAPLVGLLRHEHGGRREVVLHLDVGLGVPLLVDGIGPDEVDGLAVGDRITLRAVLHALPST